MHDYAAGYGVNAGCGLPDVSGAGRDEYCMRLALHEAERAFDAGDVPVGAIVAKGNSVVGRGSNRTVRDQDPTAHAEMLALRDAARALGTWRLDDCTLTVTLEPCAMCAGALVLSRIQRVVFGAWDDKSGMAGSIHDLLRHPRLNHRPQVTSGVLADDAASVLRRFFRQRRGLTGDDAVESHSRTDDHSPVDR
ncbi:MAG: tRNA-specific adenosine deaminase [Gemmatimonadaceae bacterium]|nr:tRNA-specific adenosine deaminase [Gemmatimonadaceae bacterium]